MGARFRLIPEEVHQDLMAWFGKLKDWEGAGDPPVEALRAALKTEGTTLPGAESLNLTLTNFEGVSVMLLLAMMEKQGISSEFLEHAAYAAKHLAAGLLDNIEIAQETPAGAEGLRWGDRFKVLSDGIETEVQLVAMQRVDDGSVWYVPDAVEKITDVVKYGGYRG